jgi:hypothetical protein
LPLVEIHGLLDYVCLYVIESDYDVLFEFLDAFDHLTSQIECLQKLWFRWGDLLAQHSNRHDKIWVIRMGLEVSHYTWASAIRTSTKWRLRDLIHCF